MIRLKVKTVIAVQALPAALRPAEHEGADEHRDENDADHCRHKDDEKQLSVAVGHGMGRSLPVERLTMCSLVCSHEASKGNRGVAQLAERRSPKPHARVRILPPLPPSCAKASAGAVPRRSPQGEDGPNSGRSR